jgi:hypothetical protein
MRLTDTAIKSARGREKRYKLFDGHGLFLLVNPNGRKGWRLKYRFNGKEKLLSSGPYPEVSLAKARDRRADASKLLVDGIDPSVVKCAEKFARLEQGTNAFEAIGREWFEKNSPRWSKPHSDRSKRLLEKALYPWRGSRPIAEIDAPELLRVIRSSLPRSGALCRWIGREIQRDASASLFLASVKRHIGMLDQLIRYGTLVIAGDPRTEAEHDLFIQMLERRSHDALQDPVKQLGGVRWLGFWQQNRKFFTTNPREQITWA